MLREHHLKHRRAPFACLWVLHLARHILHLHLLVEVFLQREVRLDFADEILGQSQLTCQNGNRDGGETNHPLHAVRHVNAGLEPATRDEQHTLFQPGVRMRELVEAEIVSWVFRNEEAITDFFVRVVRLAVFPNVLVVGDFIITQHVAQEEQIGLA